MSRLAVLLIVLTVSAAILACGDGPSEASIIPSAVPVSPTPASTLAAATPTAVPTLTKSPQPTPVAKVAPTEASTKASANRETRFEWGTCDQEAFGIECGTLHVPEGRSNPNSRMIELSVVVLRSFSEEPAPDPLVLLSGGPGGSDLRALGFLIPQFASFRHQRDVIVFDQRGVGLSEPNLDCPGYNETVLDNLDGPQSLRERASLRVEALRRCRDRLSESGLELAAYNSVENAADLRDLREQLGIEEWNLYGVSYGSRLALVTMREYPEGIRSVVLDSAYPIDADLYPSIIPNADRAFRQLFDSCAAAPACYEAYPDLEADFYEMVARLDQEPANSVVFDLLNYRSHPVLVTGDRLVDVVFGGLYSEEVIPLLPGLISSASQGDFRSFDFVLSVLVTQLGFISRGMYFSVQCGEDVAHTTPSQIEEAAQPHPRLSPYFEHEFLFEVCGFWESQTIPGFRRPVESKIPTLVLAGQFDPITPPQWGRVTAATLLNSYFFEFPAAGHGVLTSSDCSMEIALAFLREPTTSPDATCIESLGPPDFVTSE